MTTVVRLSVPDRALGGVTEHLLRVGVAAAVLEHLGEPAEVELRAEPGDTIHVAPGAATPVSAGAADALVQALAAWLDDVVGSPDSGQPRRARIELDIPVYPQLPQGNPLVERGRRVTPVTTWG